MASISELKNILNTKTTTLVLLTIATAGIYPVMWLYRHTKDIENVTKSKMPGDTYLIWIVGCTSISLYLQALHINDFVSNLGSLIRVAGDVLWVIWAFKARKGLQNYALHEHKIELPMNRFYTIIFYVFYINYCINDLPEVAREKMILSGAQEPAQAEN